MSNIAFLRKTSAHVIAEELLRYQPDTVVVFTRKTTEDGAEFNVWTGEITGVTEVLGALRRMEHHILDGGCDD